MLYIMRHGQTAWNKLYKLQGQTDIPLDDEGREMAYEAAEMYKDVHFDVCYCSPLSRAAQTAEIVLGDRKIQTIYDDRLMEMNFGIYEGLEKYNEVKDCPVNVLFSDPANYAGVENGESIDDLFKRSKGFIDEVIMPLLEQNKDVVIVAHGALNSSIICQMRGLDKSHFWDEPIQNCRLVKIC